MRLRSRALLALLTSSLALASCGTVGGGRPVADLPVKIGRPYSVKGVTYTPAAVQSYDEVGYASWYGKEQSGNPTANGESFRPKGVSAAHRTLPLPSYVEVTALNTGRTILVRVNDRGPFIDTRIIDLSHGAAEQLGIVGRGVASVRIRLVNPPEKDRARLRDGRPAADRPTAGPAQLQALRYRLAGQTGLAASKGFQDARIVANEKP
jgi:rare lipoprotein A